VFVLFALLSIPVLADAQSAPKTLSFQDVIDVAMTHNPSMKAKLAQLDVSLARADQVAVFETPVFELGALFPINSPNAHNDLDVRLTQNVDSLFSLPARLAGAKALVAYGKLALKSEVSRLLTDITIAYYKYQASQELKSLLESNLEAASAMLELSQGQLKAGNVNVLEESEHSTSQKMAKLELMRADNAMKQARLELAKLTGLSIAEHEWTVTPQLMKVAKSTASLEDTIRKGLAEQAELRALRSAVAADRSLASVSKLHLLPVFKIGVQASFDLQGNRGIGPYVEMGMPFAPQALANWRRANADLKASQARARAAEYSAAFEIEQVLQKLDLARQTVALYEDEVLPIADRGIRESLKHYNYALLGGYKLLGAKQSQLKAKQEELQARLDYWVASAELDLLTGQITFSLLELQP
jgi:cobalt-zinc-cadmium efflux system outer membrane protein